LAIPFVEFASQGNAILGIRDSGKTYTATWLAERLLDHGIPFVTGF
jgi:polynucleotide 5'-kinase involved in rRNA processing